MFIACKLEEVDPIQTSDFILSADNLYNTEQIIEMELRIYKKLDYKLNPVTPNTWM